VSVSYLVVFKLSVNVNDDGGYEGKWMDQVHHLHPTYHTQKEQYLKQAAPEHFDLMHDF
jgi:hypothetical protein